MSDNLKDEMFVRDYPVEAYWIKAYCPECRNKDLSRVTLVKEDTILLTEPPQYRYNCPECGRTFVSKENYPRIEYRYLTGEVIK